MRSNLDPHINILWLSDIHYHKNYNDKKYHVALSQYLDGFKSYMQDFEDGFDYILLSGDIAQNGEIGDYELFEKDVLGPLQSQFPDAQLLVIPGNHDVSRSDTHFIQDFIDQSVSRPDFFNAKKKEFFNVFKPYSTFFNGKRLALNSSTLYQNGALYGHVIDKKNNIIFVLLNSAWYSFGHTFLEYYLNKGLHNGKETNALKRDILKITSEYGRQMLALEILDEVDSIIEILSEYPEYLVITTMHHPTSWLHEADQITSEGENFHIIKKHSDLLLTGHEHVHTEFPYEYINDSKLLHLKAGCFADFSKEKKIVNLGEDNILNPFVVKNNWFSTLRINTKKRTVAQHKHVYGSKGWSESQNEYLLKLNKKHVVDILATRLAVLKNHINANPSDVVRRLFPKVQPINNDGIYPLGKDAVIFLRTDTITFSSALIKKYFDTGGENKLYIVLVDLYNNKSPRYISENKRLKVSNDIKNDYDFKFNIFRHDFFSMLKPEEVQKFGNLIFINKLIPFWELEY